MASRPVTSPGGPRVTAAPSDLAAAASAHGLSPGMIVRVGDGTAEVEAWWGAEPQGLPEALPELRRLLVTGRPEVWRPGQGRVRLPALWPGVERNGGLLTAPLPGGGTLVAAAPADALTASIADALGLGPAPVRPADARMAALVEAGIRLAQGSSLGETLHRLLDTARVVLDAECAALGVLGPGGTLVDFLVSGIATDTEPVPGVWPEGRGLLGVLIEDPRPLRLARIADDPRSVGFPPGHPDIDGFLGVPITLSDTVFGNLYVCGPRGGEFTAEDEQLALMLAAQAAVVVDGARRLEEERRRVAELEALQAAVRSVQETLAAAVTEHRDLDELLPVVTRQARQGAGARAACVAVCDGRRLAVRAADGEGAERLMQIRCDGDPRSFTAQVGALAGDDDLESIPLVVGGDLVGMIAAFGPGLADDGARAVLGAIGAQVAVAVVAERAVAAERERAMASVALEVARARERATADGFRRAIQAQEAERARIARELHDEAGQVLTAVALHLRAMEDGEDDPGQRAVLSDLRSVVNEAAAGLHELITDLRPAALRQHGLAPAVRQQAERLAAATGVRVDVNLDALPPELPEEVQVALFRVVQEALTNISRHSGASTASVTAAVEGDRLRVVVEDDGRGFDPAGPTTRLGLAGIRERVGLLGGRLTVDSAPGRGTAVIVEVEAGPASEV